MAVLYEGFYSASISSFHLLYIVTLGIITKKSNIIHSTFLRSLSKIVTNMILPCYIFAQITNNFKIEQSMLIFYSMIGCGFLFVFGLFMGYIISKILGLSKSETKFLAAVFSTPHTTSILLILMQCVGPVLDKIIPIQGGLTAEQRGMTYVVMNAIFANLWKWSGAYYLIEPEKKREVVDAEEALITKDKEDENKPKEEHSNSSSVHISKIPNAPIVTAILSLILTLFPTLQSYFTNKGTVLNETIISVNLMVSKSYSFICMFMLGVAFADTIHFSNEEPSRKSIFTGCDLFWLAIMKLVVMPLLACPCLIYIFRIWLHADDVLLFIFLFMACAPTAMTIIVICAYKGAYIESFSLLMIVMYAAGIVTMTLQITFFVYLIGNFNTPPSPVIPVA